MALLDNLEALVKAGFPNCQNSAESFAVMGTPTLSVAVLEDGDVSSHCYSTVGDDTGSIFQACSISKPVTALAVMRLVDKGAFTLNSTIGSLLRKDILDTLTDGCSPTHAKLIEDITLKQILSHTAGLSTPDFPGYTKSPIPSAEEVLGGKNPVNTMRIRLAALPGHSFSYSGGGFTVLQLVLESVMTKDFPSLMDELVLNPLGMQRSFFGDLPTGEKNAAKSYHTGYTPCGVTHHSQPELAAAGLWTTPTDLLKIVIAVQKSLVGDAFLRMKTAKEMLTEVDSDMNMALSWFLSESKVGFTHSGSNEPGFRCILAGFASLGSEEAPENCGYAIMTNSANGTMPFVKVAQAITYLKGWPVFRCAGLHSVVVPFPDPNASLAESWNPWLGEWTSGSHTCVLGESDGKPTFSFDGSCALGMISAAMPLSKDQQGQLVFILEGFDMRITLGAEAAQRVIKLGSEMSNRELLFEKETS